MKHRIRVVVDIDVSPDGQPAKAWLQYDTKTEKTVKECRRAFAKQLGLRNPDELELVIEGEEVCYLCTDPAEHSHPGFKVLDSLSSETLDAVCCASPCTLGAVADNSLLNAILIGQRCGRVSTEVYLVRSMSLTHAILSGYIEHPGRLKLVQQKGRT